MKSRDLLKQFLWTRQNADRQHSQENVTRSWKEAEVIPILKDGDHEEAANNRPLSLLAVASKVSEKIILNQLNAYLVGNKRLMSPLSGYKIAHSTDP